MHVNDFRDELGILPRQFAILVSTYYVSTYYVMYSKPSCLRSKFTRCLCMKVKTILVTQTCLVRTKNLQWQWCPAEMDGAQQLMLYWINPIDSADSLAAKPELYFHYATWRQESEQRPTKGAFGCANFGLVFQEAQLLYMYSDPFTHLFYGDNHFLDNIGVTIQSMAPM
jgi:hypothetical protein